MPRKTSGPRSRSGALAAIASGALLACCALLALPPAAIAGDRVVMKSGAIFRGTIVEETRDEVIMDITGLGRVRLIRDRILDIEADPGPAPAAAPEVPAGPSPSPDVRPPVADRAGANPEKPTPSPFDIPWGELAEGRRALVLLRGADHGDWIETGARYLAEVAVVTPSRLKIVFDEERGPLGNAWVPKERIERIVDPGDSGDRLLVFMEDVEVGAWIDCRTRDGRMLAGRLARFSNGGRMTIEVPHAAGVEPVDIGLADLRVFSAVVRRATLTAQIEEVRPGEPIGLTICGRPEPVTGRFLGRDEENLLIAVAGDRGEMPETRRLFAGSPIVKIRRLPAHLRAAFEGAAPGDRIEVFSVTEDERETVRTRVEGALVHATPETILLDTADGLAAAPAATMKRARRILGEGEATAALRKSASEAECKLGVLPGMDRKAAEAAIPADPAGIDVLYGPDGVEKVYCRPPFTGPVFGIRLGLPFEPQMESTDLVFQEWRTPKIGGDLALTTVTSHTLIPLSVTFLLSAEGVVLAAEISAR